MDEGAGVGHGGGCGLLLVEGGEEVLHDLLKQLLLAAGAQVTWATENVMTRVFFSLSLAGLQSAMYALFLTERGLGSTSRGKRALSSGS